MGFGELSRAGFIGLRHPGVEAGGLVPICRSWVLRPEGFWLFFLDLILYLCRIPFLHFPHFPCFLACTEVTSLAGGDFTGQRHLQLG